MRCHRVWFTVNYEKLRSNDDYWHATKPTRLGSTVCVSEERGKKSGDLEAGSAGVETPGSLTRPDMEGP